MAEQSESQQWREEEERSPRGNETAREPPVLPVSTSPQLQDSGEQRTPSAAAATTSSGATGTLPAAESQIPTQSDVRVEQVRGLSERIDAWQVSSLPEEKTYFAMDSNLIEAAVTGIKARLGERDGNVRNAWLLSEIDHWDLEKERMLVLTDNNLISVKYNFIHSAVEELKYIPLDRVVEGHFGDFKYTYSFVYSRTGKGLKIFWGRAGNVGFWDHWNPFTQRIPYTIFASHILFRRNRVTDPQLNVENAVAEIERAITDVRRTSTSGQQQHGEAATASPSTPEEFKVKQTDIVFDTYLGVSARIHNDSNLGYFKRRGLVDW